MPLESDANTTTTKPAGKKGGKACISNIMDDAPLFAGLDGFVLQPSVRLKAEATKADQKKVNKKAATERTKPAASGHSLPQTPLKAGKAPSTETGSMLLSVAEMCKLLKISRATLVRMDKSGQLPGRIKLGGSVRFHRETVETWLQSLITTHPAPS